VERKEVVVVVVVVDGEAVVGGGCKGIEGVVEPRHLHAAFDHVEWKGNSLPRCARDETDKRDNPQRDGGWR
jgi:hypothetical protein